MKQKETLREYRFPDSFLIQKADDLINSITRDEVEFTARGYTVAKRTALTDLREAFSDLPMDSSYEGAKISTTQEKDTLRDQLENKLRTVFSIFEYKYGTSSGKYKELGGADITHLTDDKLVRVGRQVKSVCDKYFDELKNDGLTSQMITDVENLTHEFDMAVDAQLAAIKNRDVKTEERIEAGNALYRELVKAAIVGKDIWYSVSEAKYNDYVIYDTPSGQEEPEPPPVPPTP